MIYSKINSPWGTLIAGLDNDGFIEGLWMEGQKYFPKIPQDATWMMSGDEHDQASDIRSREINHQNLELCLQTFKQLQDQMMDYAKGRSESFNLPLAPKGTQFQQLVWKVLLEIPYGQTWTYGEVSLKVALLMGRKSMSTQATGGAIGRNPISIIIPCHRVIGKNGSLTGFAGGLDKKEALLNHEKAIL